VLFFRSRSAAKGAEKILDRGHRTVAEITTADVGGRTTVDQGATNQQRNVGIVASTSENGGTAGGAAQGGGV
jgi:hypothetical protein